MSIEAKRFNERVKLTANALNTLGIALVIAAFVFPIARFGDLTALSNPITYVWVFAGFVLHLIAHAVLGTLKSED